MKTLKEKIVKHRYIVIPAIILIIFVGGMVLWRGLPYVGWGPKPGSSFVKEYGLVLHDYDGKEVRMSAFRGKIMVAYAWASWCPYCAAELQNLGRLKQVYGDSLQVVAVNRGEPLSVARGYTDHLTGLDGLLLLLDPTDSFFKSMGGYAMPETVFIDDHGKIIFHQRGPMQFDEVSKRMQELTK